MRIGINGAVLASQPNGIHRYTSCLLDGLDQVNPTDIDITLFTSSPAGEWKTIDEVKIDPDGTFSRVLWDSVGFSRSAKAAAIDVAHSPDKGPLLKRGTPVVVTIHDLLPYYYPDERQIPNRLYWQLSLRRQATLSDLILTVSESSKQDIIDVFGVDESKVRITPLGTKLSRPSEEKISRVREKYGIKRDVFNILYVGNFDERKNVSCLVEAARQISQEGANVELFLAGGNPPKIHLSELAGKFSDRIHFLGYVPDDDLEGLYSAVDTFVYPSSYEGFGLPVLEAMACGTSVVTSNTSSLPEVVGDAGITVRPERVDELANSLYHLYTDESLREKLASKGLSRANNFTWERTALETLEAYQKIMR